MGLGDWLGGKKMPAPPRELRQSAEAVYGLAGDVGQRFDQLGVYNDDFLSRYAPGLTDTLAGDYGAARDTSIGQADVFGGLFSQAGAPILRQQAAETLAAGGIARQNDEAQRARDAVLAATSTQQQGLADSMLRRGIMGGVSDSPHVAALTGANAAAAANNARLQERNYGEMVRRQYAPLAAGFADAAMGRHGQAAQYAHGELNAREMLPSLAAAGYGRESALGSQASGLYGDASSLFGRSYQADVAKAQADNDRRSAIAGSIAKLGGMALGGAAGFAGGGGFTGALTGAYNASQGMPISFPGAQAGGGTNFGIGNNSPYDLYGGWGRY